METGQEAVPASVAGLHRPRRAVRRGLKKAGEPLPDHTPPAQTALGRSPAKATGASHRGLGVGKRIWRNTFSASERKVHPFDPPPASPGHAGHAPFVIFQFPIPAGFIRCYHLRLPCLRLPGFKRPGANVGIDVISVRRINIGSGDDGATGRKNRNSFFNINSTFHFCRGGCRRTNPTPAPGRRGPRLTPKTKRPASTHPGGRRGRKSVRLPSATAPPRL